MSLRLLAPLLMVAAAAVPAVSQAPPVPRPVPPDVEWLDAPPPDALALAADPAAFAGRLEANGLALDLERGTLAVRGAVLHDETSLAGYPIEYLVVTERGRTHEALVLVRAQPALLEACLRALGLAPGSPMHFAPREPPPTAAQLEAGELPWEVVAPSGPLVDVRLAWTGTDGAPRELPLESALLDLRTGEALPTRHWVFTGGGYGPLRQGRRVLQTYLADAQGDIVGISPLDRGGEGVCVLERNSAEGADDSLYTVNGALAPPLGTPVTLLLRPTGERAAPVAAPRPEEVVAGDTGARLDAWLERLRYWGFSGTVLVERGGEVLLHKGYGLADRVQGTPASTATVWPLSSLSKAITAAGILQLEAAGQLKLDDILARHLDGVPEDKAGVTLRHLLQHASGLPESFTPAPAGDGRRDTTLGSDRRATVKRILAEPLRAAPGAEFRYSSLGYALLAAVLESAADDIYRGYLGEHVFGPAAMTSAGLFGEPLWSAERLARGHAGPPGAQQPVPQPAYGPLTWESVGAGAVVCTVRDVHRWVRALVDGTLLEEPQRTTMFTPGLGGYGCGWWIEDGGEGRGRLAWHDGLLPGYRTELRRYLDADATLVVAGNSELLGLAAPLADLLFGAPVQLPPAVGALDAAAAAALEGGWGEEPGPRLALSAPRGDEGALWATPGNQAALDLLDGADGDERARRGKQALRTTALLVSVANARWDECAGALGQEATAAECEAMLGPWWKQLGEGLGAPVEPRVLAVGEERGATAVDVEVRFEHGVARRRVLWRDGALADIRLPGGELGALRLLPAAGEPGRWVSYALGDGPGTELSVRPDEPGVLRVAPAGGPAQALRRRP